MANPVRRRDRHRDTENDRGPGRGNGNAATGNHVTPACRIDIEGVRRFAGRVAAAQRRRGRVCDGAVAELREHCLAGRRRNAALVPEHEPAVRHRLALGVGQLGIQREGGAVVRIQDPPALLPRRSLQLEADRRSLAGRRGLLGRHVDGAARIAGAGDDKHIVVVVARDARPGGLGDAVGGVGDPLIGAGPPDSGLERGRLAAAGLKADCPPGHRGAVGHGGAVDIGHERLRREAARGAALLEGRDEPDLARIGRRAGSGLAGLDLDAVACRSARSGDGRGRDRDAAFGERAEDAPGASVAVGAGGLEIAPRLDDAGLDWARDDITRLTRGGHLPGHRCVVGVDRGAHPLVLSSFLADAEAAGLFGVAAAFYVRADLHPRFDVEVAVERGRTDRIAERHRGRRDPNLLRLRGRERKQGRPRQQRERRQRQQALPTRNRVSCRHVSPPPPRASLARQAYARIPRIAA